MGLLSGGLGWDEELPAGYQDADLELAELHRQADEDANNEADYTMCDTCGDWVDRPEGSACECGGVTRLPAPDPRPRPEVVMHCRHCGGVYFSHASYLLDTCKGGRSHND
jgi:hypothetical protein